MNEILEPLSFKNIVRFGVLLSAAGSVLAGCMPSFRPSISEFANCTGEHEITDIDGKAYTTFAKCGTYSVSATQILAVDENDPSMTGKGRSYIDYMTGEIYQVIINEDMTPCQRELIAKKEVDYNLAAAMVFEETGILQVLSGEHRDVYYEGTATVDMWSAAMWLNDMNQEQRECLTMTALSLADKALYEEQLERLMAVDPRDFMSSVGTATTEQKCDLMRAVAEAADNSLTKGSGLNMTGAADLVCGKY